MHTSPHGSITGFYAIVNCIYFLHKVLIDFMEEYINGIRVHWEVCGGAKKNGGVSLHLTFKIAIASNQQVGLQEDLGISLLLQSVYVFPWTHYWLVK